MTVVAVMDKVALDEDAVARAEWLENRRRGVGGSDAAVVMGVSAYKSLWALWAEKTGLVPADANPPSEAAEWGTRLEGLVCAKYAEVTGRRLRDLGRYTVLTHSTRSYMRATLDREIHAIDERGDGNLEAKTAGATHADEWEAGVPLYYQVQVQHQLAVTGRKWASVAVLIGGQRFRWYDVERNDDFIAELEAQCEWFWGLVERKEEPPVDGHPATKEAIRRAFPLNALPEVALPDEAPSWDARLVEVKAELKRLYDARDLLENQIKAAIGEHAAGRLPDGTLYKWTAINKDAYTVAAHTERRLTRHAPKLRKGAPR